MTGVEIMKAIGDAIVETVDEVGEAPSGAVYAAVMSKLGIDLFVYETIISALVSAGRIRKQGDLLLRKDT